MGETDYNSLPIILVSAKDNVAASYLISEIIDNDVTEIYKAQDEGDIVKDKVWRIVNKYYTADVRLQECGDPQLPFGDEPVDAHIIYIQEDECSAATCSRRAVAGAGVQLVVSAGAGGALAAWAAASQYELVELTAAEDDDDDGQDSGLPRVRAALHAHVWRGLRRTDRAPPPPIDDGSGSESSPGESEGDAESGCEAGVARLERFAAALAALPGAAGAARGAGAGAGAGAGGDRQERLARAELLLAEFCHALGLDLDHC